MPELFMVEVPPEESTLTLPHCWIWPHPPSDCQLRLPGSGMNDVLVAVLTFLL